MLRATCLVAASLFALNGSAHAAPANRVVVGGKNFTEQLILSTITAQYLTALGYRAVLRNGLGSTLMRSAQENGQLDVVWEYTGTSLILYNHVTEKLDADATYARVKQLDAQKGLIWLDESKINNTYAIAMPRAAAGDLNTLSELSAKMRSDPRQRRHLLAMDAEFAGRSDGLRPLMALYGMPLTRRDIKQMDPGLVYTALRNKQVMAGVVYTTDGRVHGFALKLLADDRHYFPAYRATPVVRRETLDANPQLATQLNRLAAALDTPTMTVLNAKVDMDQQSINRISREFLVQRRLIKE